MHLSTKSRFCKLWCAAQVGVSMALAALMALPSSAAAADLGDGSRHFRKSKSRVVWGSKPVGQGVCQGTQGPIWRTDEGYIVEMSLKTPERCRMRWADTYLHVDGRNFRLTETDKNFVGRTGTFELQGPAGWMFFKTFGVESSGSVLGLFSAEEGCNKHCAGDLEVREAAAAVHCTVRYPRIGGYYEGECRNGLAHGRGTLVAQTIAGGLSSGDEVVDLRLEGEFRQGLPDGHAKFDAKGDRRYEGQFKQGYREGFGQLTLAPGVMPPPGMRSVIENGQHVVRGLWSEGRLKMRCDSLADCQQALAQDGLVADAAGCRAMPPMAESGLALTWSGPCVEGLAHGWGRQVWSKSGKVVVSYEGELARGRRHGDGQVRWSDGARYAGGFVENLQTGQASLVRSDGSSYDGELLNGKPHGRGIAFDPGKDGRLRGESGHWEKGDLAMLSHQFAAEPAERKIRNSTWPGWDVLDEPVPVGTGLCSTTRTLLAQAPGHIVVSVRRPPDCAVQALRLSVDGDELFLTESQGLKAANATGSRTWSARVAHLKFATHRTYTRQQLQAAALWDDRCAGSACLRDEVAGSRRVAPAAQVSLERAVGRGECKTVVRSLRKLRGLGDVVVDLDAPAADCVIRSPLLVIGGDVNRTEALSLAAHSGLQAKPMRMLQHTLSLLAPSGGPVSLRFSATQPFNVAELKAARLVDPECLQAGASSCLTETISSNVENLPLVPPALTLQAPSRPEDQVRAALHQARDTPTLAAFLAFSPADDPQGLLPGVRERLRAAWLADGRWPALQSAWEQVPDRAVFDRLLKAPRNAAEQAMLEALLAEGLPASALFRAERLSLQSGAERRVRGERLGLAEFGELWRRMHGQAVVTLAPNGPMRLSMNSYTVRLVATLHANFERQGSGLGTNDGTEQIKVPVVREVTLSAANGYGAKVDVDFGELRLAYADRGIMGGFTQRRLSEEPVMTVEIERFWRAQP